MLTRRSISLAFVILWLVIGSSPGTAQRRTAKPAPPPPTELPASVLGAQLKAMGGSSFSLSEHSGKILVINLWATWCGPCRMETPELIKLQEEFRNRDVIVVGLSTEDAVESEEAVQEWVENFAVPYRIGWATTKMASWLMHGRDAVPQTFVVSGSGRIVTRFIGFNPTITPSQWRKAVNEAIDERAIRPNTSDGGKQ